MKINDIKKRGLVIWSVFSLCFSLPTYSNVQPALGEFNKTMEISFLLDQIRPFSFKESIIHELEWTELALHDTLAQINKTITSFGPWGIGRAIVPTANPELIKANQKRLQSIINRPKALESIKQALGTIKNNEEAILLYYKDSQFHHDVKKLYYGIFQNYLNHNQFALDAAFLVDFGKTTFAITAPLGMQGIFDLMISSNLKEDEFNINQRVKYLMNSNSKQTLFDRFKGWLTGKKETFSLDQYNSMVQSASEDLAQYKQRCEEKISNNAQLLDELRKYPGQNSLEHAKLEEFLDQDISKPKLATFLSGIKKGLMGPIRGHDPRHNLFNNEGFKKDVLTAPGNNLFKVLFFGDASAGDKYTFLNEGFDVPKPLAAMVVAMATIGLDVQLFLQLKNAYGNLQFMWSTPEKLAHELKSIAEFIDACKIIAASAEGIDELSSWQPMTQLKKLLHTHAVSLKMHKLIDLLDEIKKQANSPLYSRGRILLAHQLMTEVKFELLSFLESIAHIDAFISFATLMNNATQERPWCFVEFIDHQKPAVHLDGFWLPILNNEIVLNSITWGMHDKAHKIILTGPNGGGKSTIMKAICYQIIFAQSYGIAPAQKAQMTLFKGLKTAFNPQEDLKQGLSTFMAQKQRMNELMQCIEDDAAGFTLIAVDEPYRGTVESTSQKLVYDFCSKIAKQEHCMLMMATHFELPTTLELQTGGLFANYQCEFVQTDDGKLIRTYKLQPGAAYWWFHDDQMRSLYLQHLEEAIAIGSSK